jgi:hypothetical protein
MHVVLADGSIVRRGMGIMRKAGVVARSGGQDWNMIRLV